MLRIPNTLGWKGAVGDVGAFPSIHRMPGAWHISWPALRWGGPTQLLHDQDRWDTAVRRLHDENLKAENRLAGLPVLLYAQNATAISQMPVDPHRNVPISRYSESRWPWTWPHGGTRQRREGRPMSEPHTLRRVAGASQRPLTASRCTLVSRRVIPAELWLDHGRRRC
jgi:hypothetical protein